MRNGEKYTTGDMQSMFGLTNKGLFHYEKKGIVAPTRLDNQYRVLPWRTAHASLCRASTASWGFLWTSA